MRRDILAIVLGGFGKGQMGTLTASLRQHPRFVVPDVPWINSYAARVGALLDAFPTIPNVIAIGHSFGAHRLLEMASPYWCRYMALIDPVAASPFVRSHHITVPMPRLDWFQRDPIGVTLGVWEQPLKIVGAGAPIHVSADPALRGRYQDLHNELPHQPGLIDTIINHALAACEVPLG
jgi:pimeloyl-ACP methyl ester carboxylesterase